ncbi:unnamed protein product, partial [marine sediment metagenome]
MKIFDFFVIFEKVPLYAVFLHSSATSSIVSGLIFLDIN